MSRPFPWEIKSEEMTIRFESPEEVEPWIGHELRAWAWLFGFDEPRRDQYHDLLRRPAALRQGRDNIGRAGYLRKNEPHTEVEQERLLSEALTNLELYVSSFPISQSGAGKTFCRIAETDPSQALAALYAYIGSGGALPPPPILWHYTTVPALIGILQSETLWASDTRFLNDSSEISYTTKLLDGMLEYKGYYWGFARPEQADPEFWDIERRTLPRQGQSRIRRQMLLHRGGTRIYTTSFCEDANLLSQWRAYGSRQPIAVAFDTSELKTAAASHGGTLERCIYDPTQQRKLIAGALKPHLQKFFDDVHEDPSPNQELLESRLDANAIATVRAFAPLMPMCKHPDFREEREWRVIIQLQNMQSDGVHGHPTANGMAPRFHIKLPKPALPTTYVPPDQRPALLIKEIVVGPGPSQQSTFEALTLELRKLWPGLPEPKCSETPYVQQ